jgi:hypothetical protein
LRSLWTSRSLSTSLAVDRGGLVVVSAEHRALHHAIDDLRIATTSLHSAHGDVPTVARLRNDLERLILDVADADALPPPSVAASASAFVQPSAAAFGANPAQDGPDDAYTAPSWDDVDDEGVGGFRGPATKSRR